MTITEQARELCYAIEDLPASEQQTKLSIMASDLQHAIQKLEVSLSAEVAKLKSQIEAFRTVPEPTPSIPPASPDKAQGEQNCRNCKFYTNDDTICSLVGEQCTYENPKWQPKPALAQEKPREWTAEDRLCWLEDHPECFAPSSAVRLYAMRHALNEYIDGQRPTTPTDSGKAQEKGN